MSRFFSENDFSHCSPPCKSEDLRSELLASLDYARSLYGKPMYLTSAYRSKDYEHLQGRPGTSSHCRGLAVDIACHDSVSRLNLVKSLLRAGFRRIGVGPAFIHVDIDPDKPQCMWLY